MTSPAKRADGDRAAHDLATRENNYESLDPLDPRKISLDVFELYCHEMLATDCVARRAFLISKMRYIIRRLIGHQYDYGRLYNRTCIANIVSRLCGRHAYVKPKKVAEGYRPHQLLECLVDTTAEKWKKIMVQFELLRESMLQNDAALFVLPAELDDDDGNGRSGSDSEEFPPEEDDEVNEERASHIAFTEGYENMMALMKFHTCLSHLQPYLETAIQTGSASGAESVVIPRENIIAFNSAIEEQFRDEDDSEHGRILKDLLEVNKKINRSTRSVGLHLKSLSEITAIYDIHSRYFDLERFQNKFLKLIGLWADMVLPLPELVRVNYSSTGASEDRKPMASLIGKENVNALSADPDENYSPFDASARDRKRQKRGKHLASSVGAAAATTQREEVDDNVELSSEEEVDRKCGGASEDLNRKRKAFSKKVKDPLQKSLAIAESARTSQNDEESEDDEGRKERGEKAVKGPSFHKKMGYQLEFSDSDSENQQGLSEVPSPWKGKEMAPRDIPVISRKQSARKRRKFTPTEDAAIRNGVDRFGAGQWANIKAFYAVELKDRDQVQIKDRWRTLNK
ncbi:hypothetical protein ACHAWF_017653 [Thalassiosira exigua]